ncbi:MAG: signal peptidase I [Muribaculaceae bacterium]|nr:signal peptidase I [Muribaculaceae bacterium]
MSRVKKTRWIRFGVVSVIFLAWVIWLGSWWVILFFPLIADIYLTQYIPWTWWKHIKNKTLKSVMSWVDAIVYALILVYFIFLYVGQNYQIPSSSLEKSLLVGDYLWVNKMVYGPRVPNTPLHFPLAQNTLPVLGCKSYIETPQWDYHRLKGFRKVERNDIVVFNFPAGDTVALKVQNPDYYTLCATVPGGRESIWGNKERFGDVVYRPVDRRENYVKRCIGLPGETLKIVNDVVYIDGNPIEEPKNTQYNYFIQTDGRFITDDVWNELGVSVDDRNRVVVDSNESVAGAASLGLKINIDGSVNPIYQSPLTKEMKSRLENMKWITAIVKVPDTEYITMYPITHEYGWTRANYGEVWIPAKGQSIKLTLENLPVYERCIKNYEGNDLQVKNGSIFINGKETDEYTFKMDYYWMMGDNRDNSADSRYWGFVPEDHIVGSPVFVIISFDKDKSLFNGGIRWNRIFADANPEK